MDYFNILKLNREPFSNSPDPDFFFQSGPHQMCLQKLELALRLRRGLNVVLGDVGTGKTTLCRHLIRRFSDETDIETHLILDPDIASSEEFLSAVLEMLSGSRPDPSATPWQLKETVKKILFRKGVDENRTVVLIIDEGQKLPRECLELLREFLNYETNEYKLLQIAIFAQTEFQQTLDAHANFADRINLLHRLGPMNFRDTRQMIRFRINQSRATHGGSDLFTVPALYGIYRATGGYPRKIVHLCHQCLLAVIIQNRTRAGWALVRSCAHRDQRTGRQGWWLPAGAALLILALIGAWIIVGTQTPHSPVQDAQLASAPNGSAAPVATPPVDPRPPSTDRPGDDRLNGTAVIRPVPAGDGESELTGDGKSELTGDGESELNTVVAATRRSGSIDTTDDPAISEHRASSTSTDEWLSAAEIAPPELLGRVTLGSRETLWRLVEKVYGSHDPRYLRLVQQANPHIQDLDRVEIGDRILVPAVPAQVRLTDETWIWVQLAETKTLDSAVDMLRKHPPEAPPIRLLPHWNHRDGLSFSVLLTRVHHDEISARTQRDQITRATGATPELVSAWAPDTIFYANPYRSPRM